jgi:hypothetical protein
MATIADMKSEAFHVESLSDDNDGSFYSDDAAHRGALIVEEERHLSLWASAKAHWRALLICEQALSNPFLSSWPLTVSRQCILHGWYALWLRLNRQRGIYFDAFILLILWSNRSKRALSSINLDVLVDCNVSSSSSSRSFYRRLHHRSIWSKVACLRRFSTHYRRHRHAVLRTQQGRASRRKGHQWIRHWSCYGSGDDLCLRGMRLSHLSTCLVSY